MRPGVPMEPLAVRELLAQAADGLGAAHAAGIVHRDVKPANLIVTPDRQVKVTDFGIARAAEGVGLTSTGEVMGTPQYLSPEQAQGLTATPASDVYSLGVVAFECLAGRRPFVGETAVATALAHLREPVPDLPASVPADLAAVVRRALAKDPAERFADGSAFAAALRSPATAVTAGRRRTASRSPSPRPRCSPRAAAHATTTTAYDRAGGTPQLGVAGARRHRARGDRRPRRPAAHPGRRRHRPRRRDQPEPAPQSSLRAVVAQRADAELDHRGHHGPHRRERATSTARSATSSASSATWACGSNTQRVDNPGDQIEGDVESVNPTGALQVGDTVTVTFWGPVPPESPSRVRRPSHRRAPRRRHGRHHPHRQHVPQQLRQGHRR